MFYSAKLEHMLKVKVRLYHYKRTEEGVLFLTDSSECEMTDMLINYIMVIC